MHRDKIVARILLILSVVNVAVAAPVLRQRSLDVDEDVTAALERRGYPGNTQQDVNPVPQMVNDRPSASGTAQLDNDPPPASGASHDQTPVSGTPQLDNDPPPASGAPHDQSPVSGTPQLDNDPPPASGVTHDPQPASGASHLHNDPPLALGTPQLHDHLLTTSATSSVHDDSPTGSHLFDTSYRFGDVHYVPPSSHESDTPPTDNHPNSDAPALHQPNTPPTANHPIIYAHALHPANLIPRPTNGYISNVMKERLIRVAAVSAVVGVYSGVAYGLYELFNGFHSPKPTRRNLTSSSDVVGRDVSTHPRPPRKLVSRALGNLRNEDLRLLSVLTRRALERLD